MVRFYDFSTTAELIKSLDADTMQSFYVDASKPINILAGKGTRFAMAANSFEYENGTPLHRNQIRIDVREIKNVQNAIVNNLQTQSADGMLESGGMFKMEAFDGEQLLRLKKGKSYKVDIANTNLQSGMSVYAANPLPNGMIQWTNTRQDFAVVNSQQKPQPYIKVNEEQLNQWKVSPRLRADVTNYAFQLPIPPIPPSLMHRPVKPSSINVDGFMDRLPWYRRIFMTKQQKLAWVNKKYAREFAAAEEANVNYGVALLQYQAHTASYKVSLKAYNEQMAAYRLMVNKQYELYKKFRLALMEEKMIKRFEQAKQDVIVLSRTGRLRSAPINAVRNLISGGVFSSLHDDVIIRFDFEDSLIAVYNQDARITNKQASNQFIAEMENMMTEYKENAIIANAPAIDYEQAMSDQIDKDLASGKVDASNYSMYYTAEIGQTGWINCDRFYTEPENAMRTITIPDFDARDKVVYAIVKDIGSNLAMYLNNGDYTAKLPKGKLVTIVAIGVDKNNSPVYAKVDLQVKDDTSVPVEVRPVTIAGLIKEIRNL
ncbi:MAG: hypothetical protein IPO27_17810 [Bacteroidetes bacterium]|nr:hypothetical protein [Bacteroidota bacterium]